VIGPRASAPAQDLQAQDQLDCDEGEHDYANTNKLEEHLGLAVA